MTECPPKFRDACIDFDGEQCPYYHEGTCTQAEAPMAQREA